MENQSQKINQNLPAQLDFSRLNNKTFKAKCGIFFGYNGQKYLGMQYQRDTDQTVENILHKILAEGGFILKTNQNQLKRIDWSRAARTDKKVHALCNGISIKLQIAQKFRAQQTERDIDFDKLREYLNNQLPIDIRIFSIMRVSKSFDMRHDALSRIYNYIIPLYIFQKYEHFASGRIPQTAKHCQIVQKLNNLCQSYLGTHNFHNFTKGYKQNDPRCQRYIISMKVQPVQKEVFQRYWSNHQEQQPNRNSLQECYVRFTLVGQSFIYHQIRKMVGLLIKIFAEELQGQLTIKSAFQSQKFDLYLAPAEGLYLNRMTFQAYNKRRQKNNQKIIELDEKAEQRILKFRQCLESQILNHEIKQKVFTSWLTNKFQSKGEEKEEESGQEGVEHQQETPKRQEIYQSKGSLKSAKSNSIKPLPLKSD